MKVLLIEPPAVSKFGNQRIFGGNGSNKSDFRKPPLDLMMISGCLKKEGFDNILIDANASRRTIDDVKEIIRGISPDVVFFSTSTCTIYVDLLVAQAAKEVNSTTVTVAIGTHVMALPEETFKESPYLDCIIYSSEWEQSSLKAVLICILVVMLSTSTPMHNFRLMGYLSFLFGLLLKYSHHRYKLT